jgi:hypothetical protein
MGIQAAPEYLLDMSHASASSLEASVCSVEPGSAEDVSKIVSDSDITLAFSKVHCHSYVS